MTNRWSNGTIFSSIGNGHNNVGNSLSMARNEGTQAFAYNDLYRVTSAELTTWSYQWTTVKPVARANCSLEEAKRIPGKQSS